MLEQEAKIERAVEQVEYRIGIEVVANLAAIDRLLQQFAGFNSARFDPMGPKGLQYFWLGLSRTHHCRNNLSERSAVDHRPSSHLLVNRLEDRCARRKT